jgi:hypothetical protein
MSMTEIYVALLDEGTSVWRPVKAIALPGDLYKIGPAKPPGDEVWEFGPGATVRCERRDLSEGPALVAIELVSPAI